MFGDKVEVVPVFFGHRADAEIGFRKIDAFGRTELGLVRARVYDLDQHVIGVHLADAAFDFAVIEEYRLARQRRGEDFGKRAGDVRDIAMRRGRLVYPLGQDQQIARVQANRFLDEGKVANMAGVDFLSVAHERPFGATEDVSAVIAGAEAGVIGFVDHRQLPRLPAAILNRERYRRGGRSAAESQVRGVGRQRRAAIPSSRACRPSAMRAGATMEPRASLPTRQRTT